MTMTIYELTEEERATMKRIIDAGLVVQIGVHAKVRAALNEALYAMEKMAASHRKHSMEASAAAIDKMVAHLRREAA